MANEVINSEIKLNGQKHKTVVPWPHVDLDVTYTYDNNNLTAVEIEGLGFTKTITFSYTDGKLTGKTVVIT